MQQIRVRQAGLQQEDWMVRYALQPSPVGEGHGCAPSGAGRLRRESILGQGRPTVRRRVLGVESLSEQAGIRGLRGLGTGAEEREVCSRPSASLRATSRRAPERYRLPYMRQPLLLQPCSPLRRNPREQRSGQRNSGSERLGQGQLFSKEYCPREQVGEDQSHRRFGSGDQRSLCFRRVYPKQTCRDVSGGSVSDQRDRPQRDLETCRLTVVVG